MEIRTPRDRNGSFDPKLVRKGQRRFQGFDDKILALYSRGLSTRDIEAHLEEIYDRKIKRTALLGVATRSKYWDLYREQFEEFERDRENAFQSLFGEEFAKAYHEQIQRLGATSRARSR